MSRFRIVGMDWFDVVVHVGVTVMAAVAADTMFGAGGRDSEVAISMLVAVSMIVLGIRRKRALAEAPDAPADGQRVEELEARVAELEQFQFRVAELEERADFAERMLTRGRDEAALLERPR